MTGRGSNANTTATGNFAAEKKAPNDPGRMRVDSVAICAQDDSGPSWPAVYQSKWSKYTRTHYRSRHPVPEPIKSALAANVLLRVATYSTVV